MGILDGIVEWIAEQVMNGLDLINTSVLGAMGCDMSVFLRYFPAAETMYSIFVALAIGLILLMWVWNLFKNYGLGLGAEAEDPVKLTFRSVLFILLAWYASDIVDIVLKIGGTPYDWILNSELPSLDFANFNSVLLTIIGVCASGSVALIFLILILILAWNYIKLLFEAAERYVLLANILNRLVNGSAKTFNQETNVSLDNKYTVLDISELTGDLLTVGMFVALDFVWDKAKENRTEEKAIFIDECWQLIGANSNRLAAEFVLEIFKIIRGYGGSAICATQDINDFFALEDGKYGKGIINNAKTKILLNLEDEEARRVQSLLHLSEAEVMEITHFERGNGLISTNNNNVTVEVKCSQLEKELITTDRRELQEILDKAGANPPSTG